jgi:hypothetical protein
MKLEQMTLPEELANKLKSAEKRWLGVQSLTVSLLSFSLFFVSLVLMYLSDRLWDTSVILRLFLSLLTVGSFIVFLVSHFKTKKAYRKTPYKIITMIQKHYPSLGDSLQGAVELAHEDSRPDNISAELCRAAVSQVASSSAELKFVDSVNTQQRNKMGLYFGALTLLLLAMAGLDSQALSNSFERWLNPFSETERYTFVQIEDLPEELIVLHGEPFELEVKLKENSRFQPSEISWNFASLSSTTALLNGGAVSLKLPGQTEPTELTVFSYDMQKKVRIIPIHRPALTEIQALVKMPEYLQHKDLHLELQGKSLEIIEGSEIIIEGVSNNELESAQVFRPKLSFAVSLLEFTGIDIFVDLDELLKPYRENSPSITKSVSGHKFKSQKFSVEKEDQLYINWRDKFGFQPKDSFLIRITSLKDDAPQVEFDNVSRSFALLSTENITLPMNASDNFGVRYLKVEYEVQSSENSNYSKTFSHLVKKGGAHEKSLSAEFIFSPTQLNIPAGSTVKIRALTNDYLPERKDVKSVDYKVYVLSKEEHARLIQDRFDSLNSKLEDVGLQEDENLQKNLQLAEMSEDELNSQKGTDALEDSLAAEKANSRRLEQLIDEGQKLIEEALKNDEFQEEQLREWAEMLDDLDELQENELAEAQESLAQASQEESANSGLRIDGLKSAIQKQKEALRKLRRLSKDFDENMKKATLRNFAARLRTMSKEQAKISRLLKELFVKSVGLDFENLPEDLKQLNDVIFEAQKKKINGSLDVIKLEIGSFYARTKIEKYREVSEDIEAKNSVNELKKLLELIELNKANSSIKPSGDWAKIFKTWADMLDPKNDDKENDNQEQNAQENEQKNMEMLLAIIRLIEEEQDLHDETKFIEWEFLKDAEDAATIKKHQEKAVQLAERQKVNIDKLKEVRKKLKKSKATELIDGAENAMDEAERLLRKAKSGANTLAAESAAIELLISLFDANNKGSSSSSSMAAMMQQMMQQGNSSSGSKPGGSTSGGQASIPTETAGLAGGDKPSERTLEKHTGLALEDVPVEFREALESYYREVEKSLE